MATAFSDQPDPPARPGNAAAVMGTLGRFPAAPLAAPGASAPNPMSQPSAPSIAGALGDSQFRRGVGRGVLDAANRGLVAGALGSPVDAAAGVVNAGLMGAGYAGHKMGLLSADQMPQPATMPVGGSAWIGQKMQDLGMVSPQRNTAAETLATLAGPAAMLRGARGFGALSEMPPAITPSSGGPTSAAAQLGAMSPDGRARLLADLQAGKGSGTYRLGDVTQGQLNALKRLGVPSTTGRDVMMTDAAHQHLMNSRIGRDGFNAEEVVRFAKQAMEPRSAALRDPTGAGHKEALANDGLLDATSRLRYTAQMPLRAEADRLSVVTVIPRGIPARKTKAPE